MDRDLEFTVTGGFNFGTERVLFLRSAEHEVNLLVAKSIEPNRGDVLQFYGIADGDVSTALEEHRYREVSFLRDNTEYSRLTSDRMQKLLAPVNPSPTRASLEYFIPATML